MRVQHWLPEALEADFEGAECDACGMVHFVNRKGEVFGAKDRDKRPVTWETQRRSFACFATKEECLSPSYCLPSIRAVDGTRL